MGKYVIWNFDFRDKINYDNLNKLIDKFIKENPNTELVLQVPSTKGATSSCVRKIDNRVKIRIAGAFDDERVRNYKNVVYKLGARCQEAYVESVIYTRNETIKILEAIEEIEKGIMPNWSDIQKMIYIYDKIKTTIMYDPKYQSKTWAEIRTLRGIITRQTVCAGYAVILKEILERNGIRCEYVSSSNHAWNVVIIDDVMYPVDLTNDNYYFRHGHKNTHQFLGQSPIEFTKSHVPAKEEPNKEYSKNLSELDSKIVEQISSSINIVRNHTSTSSIVTRNNHSKFYIAQVGSEIIENPYGEETIYYKYYFQELDNKSNPVILYSKENVNDFLNTLLFGQQVTDEYEDAVSEILFSEENIKDSIAKGTSYIGKALNESSQRVIKSRNEIIKRKDEIERFKINQRVFHRKDGSKALVESLNETKVINGRKIYKYELFEMLPEENIRTVKSFIIYSEQDLIKDKNLNTADTLLSVDRIVKKCTESGGYIGYISQDNKIKYNKKIANYFDINKKIELSHQSKNIPLIIPSFSELQDYARDYEVMISSKNGNIVVRNIKTKKEVVNEKLRLKIIFANIWLSSAGLKENSLDTKPGIKNAFSKEREKLYKILIEEFQKNIITYGTIDSLNIFKQLYTLNNKEHSKIIINLFKNEFNANMIYKLFINSLSQEVIVGLSPQVLKNEEHALQLLQFQRKY